MKFTKYQYFQIYFAPSIFCGVWRSLQKREILIHHVSFELFLPPSDLETLLSIWLSLYLWIILWLSIYLPMWHCMILSGTLWRDSELSWSESLSLRLQNYQSRYSMNIRSKIEERIISSFSLIAKIISRIFL